MDKDKEFEAYHRGYDQGRFDEYADQMGYNKAKLIKNRIEKQKNCPYCHDRANLLQSNDERPIDGDIVYISKDGYLNSETDECHVYRKIKYCPMCGRPLGGNEDD